MAVYALPSSIVSPIDGQVALMPHHPDYTAVDDLTDAVQYWLSATIGADGYASMSGASPSSKNTIQLCPGGITLPIEYGLDFGQYSKTSAHVDRQGIAWPAVPAHGWCNAIVDGQGGRILQADNTKYDGGLITGITGDIAYRSTPNPGQVIVTNITPALTANQLRRMSLGTNYLRADAPYQAFFTGGGKVNSVQVVVNGSGELVLTLGNCFIPGGYPLFAVPITIDIPPQETRRQNGFHQFGIGAPGSFNGVERDCMSHDLIVRNLTIEMGNTNYLDAVTNSVEQWIGVNLRGCDGVLFEPSVRLKYIWSDAVNLGNTSQVGAPDSTPVQAENVTFCAQCDGIGRHAVTDQGSVNFDDTRATYRNISHFRVDSEPTNGGARVINPTYGGACDPGYSMYSATPLGFIGDPPVTRSVTQGPTATTITVPYDTIDNRHLGSRITGTGIPTDTFTARRLSPTVIELTKAVSISGTITALFGSPSLFRNVNIDRLAVFAANPEIVLPRGPRLSGVEFTGTTTVGSKVITNIVMEPRADGLTFTTSDIGTVKVINDASGIIPNGAPTAVTSTTVTLPNNALKAVAPTTFTGIATVAESRQVTSPTSVWVASDKGRGVTGTGIFPGSKIDSFVNSKTVMLSMAATATGTTDLVATGSRFTFEAAPAEWGPYNVDRMRNIGGGKFGGSLVGYTNPDSPMFLFPSRSVANVTHCMARANVGSQGVCQTAVANVASLPADISLTAPQPTGWTDPGYVRIVTSTGSCTVRYTSRSGSFIHGCTLVSGTGSISVGAAYSHLKATMVGYWDGTAPVYGIMSGGTMTGNKWQDAIDDQAAEPTVTASIVLTASDVHVARPTFTAVITFSDGRTCDKESLLFVRDGVQRGAAVCDGNTATFTPWTDSPAGAPHLWKATWGNGTYGSWDTLPATSNTVTQFPSNTVTATTTILTLDPASPSTTGTTVNFEAIVSPTPDGGLVTFYVDGVAVAGADPPDATWGQPLDPGVHTLSAVYEGTAAFAASSSSVTYESTAVVVSDTTPPVVTPISPLQGDTVSIIDAEVSWSYDETVTGDYFQLRTDDVPFQIVNGTTTAVGNTRTFVPEGCLEYGRTYTPVVQGATDSSGNTAGRVSWQFSTVREQIETGNLVARGGS